MKQRDVLIFWFDQPPKVSLGAYNYVSKNWGNKVIYMIDHPLGDHRKMINWDNTDYADAEIVMLSDAQDEQKCIEEVFQKYPDAVHVLNGFVSDIEKKVGGYLRRPGVKFVVTTEKPLGSKRSFTFQKWVRNRLTPFKYKVIFYKYKKYAKAVIPLGLWGKSLFESYGWLPEQVFSYMYCPNLCDIEKTDSCSENENLDVVNFLYVGRFNYTTRGLDVIMNSFDRLSTKNWHLDIVGGYGDQKDEVINWATNRENVSYLGIWPAETVGKRMQEYDVYLVPTKADGWNSQINEALNAGIGVITTDEAVSDEMITASNAGKVVRAADNDAFHNALESVLGTPSIIREWKKNARKYRCNIAVDVVGDYFIDILEYVFYNKKDMPKCPWLNV